VNKWTVDAIPLTVILALRQDITVGAIISMALVTIVHVKAGVFSGRTLKDIRFVLVQPMIRGLGGPFIKVSGLGINGFPQRNIKIYINDEETDVEYIEIDQSAVKEAIGFIGESGSTSDFNNAASGELLEPVSSGSQTPEDSLEDVRKRMIERFGVLSEMSIAAAKGALRGLLIYGPPGLGKSFEVEKAMELANAISAQEFARLSELKKKLTARENDIDYVEDDNDPEIDDAASINDVKACFDVNPETGEETITKQVFHIHKGFVRAAGLYAFLYEHRHAHNVLVFDDTKAVLDEDDCAELLKSALDTTKKRVISWTVSARRDGLPLSFTFDASIIFISNDDFDAMAKAGRLTPHLEAILDRCLSIDIMLKTAKEKLVRIDYVSRDQGMIENRLSQGVNAVSSDKIEMVREELLAWVHKNYHKFNNLSLRKILHLADLYKSGPHWERLAEITLLKGVR
jgi:hypothetical protein